MKRLAAFLFSALICAASAEAQTHVHNKTCLGGMCRPSAPPQISQPIVQPRADLGRLEATTEAIREEQRYGSHIAYQQLSELQQIKLLLAMGATKEAAKDAAAADAVARDAWIRSIPPTQIPDLRTLTPTPIPDIRTVPPTQIPDPRTLTPTPIPDPRGVPPTPISTSRQISHQSWPNVRR